MGTNAKHSRTQQVRYTQLSLLPELSVFPEDKALADALKTAASLQAVMEAFVNHPLSVYTNVLALLSSAEQETLIAVVHAGLFLITQKEEIDQLSRLPRSLKQSAWDCLQKDERSRLQKLLKASSKA